MTESEVWLNFDDLFFDGLNRIAGDRRGGAWGAGTEIGTGTGPGPVFIKIPITILMGSVI